MANVNVSLPSDGQTIDASDYGTPINTIVNDYNGNIDNSNIAAAAAIAGSKLADAGITKAKLAAYVAQNNPYSFRAYDSGGTTLTDNTAVKINLATESYDYNSNFASSTYTCPVAGVYHFAGSLLSSAIATHVGASIRITKNGTTAFYGNASSDSTGYLATCSGDILCAANDTIELYFFQNSAGSETSVTGSDSTWLSGHLVHAI